MCVETTTTKSRYATLWDIKVPNPLVRINLLVLLMWPAATVPLFLGKYYATMPLKFRHKRCHLPHPAIVPRFLFPRRFRVSHHVNRTGHLSRNNMDLHLISNTTRNNKHLDRPSRSSSSSISPKTVFQQSVDYLSAVRRLPFISPKTVLFLS